MTIFPKIRVRPRLRQHAPVARRSHPRNPRPAAPAPASWLDLSQAVRTADSVDHLYESIAAMIRQAFSVSAVSLFLRDEEAGDFPCRVSTMPENNGDMAPALPSGSFVIRRLQSLSFPVHVDPEELSMWSEALKDAPAPVLERRMRERDTLLQTRSSLLVQLRSKNDLVGVLSLGDRALGRLSSEEIAVLNGIAGQLALVVENTRLLERMVEHERLRAELSLAAGVQRNLLPTGTPDLPGIDICGVCQPASQVGGDYYDFIPLADGLTGICVADVAGKGISAALLMSVVQASLRTQLLNGHNVPVRHIVSLLNRLICGSVSTARYVTCFYAQLDSRNGSVQFVNAGHNPPLLFSRSTAQPHEGTFHRLAGGGTVLGLFPDSAYEEERVLLKADDVLVAFTDGVTESFNATGVEFGEERLQAAIAKSAGRTAQQILESILAEVKNWSKGMPPHDDLTIIVLKKL